MEERVRTSQKTGPLSLPRERHFPSGDSSKRVNNSRLLAENNITVFSVSVPFSESVPSSFAVVARCSRWNRHRLIVPELCRRYAKTEVGNIQGRSRGALHASRFHAERTSRSPPDRLLHVTLHHCHRVTVIMALLTTTISTTTACTLCLRLRRSIIVIALITRPPPYWQCRRCWPTDLPCRDRNFYPRELLIITLGNRADWKIN